MFEPYRNTAKRFLEIGVAQGYSLRMWRDMVTGAGQTSGRP